MTTTRLMDHLDAAAPRLTEVQLQQLARNGFITTDVAFDSSRLEKLGAEFTRVWQDAVRTAEKIDAKAARLTRVRPFLVDMHKASPACASFLKHPALMNFCRQIIGPDIECVYNQAVLKPPTAEKRNSFAWHQDAYYGVHGSESHLLDHAAFMDPHKCFVSWVAVTRTTVANGTIWVVPGMHRHGLLPHKLDDDTGEWVCQFDSSAAVPVELQAGQMALFSPLLPHYSRPNVSNEIRMAYQFTYSAPGVKRGSASVFPVLKDGVVV